MSSIPTGSIDYSPSSTVRRHTIILQNEELLVAKHNQFERFFRVWFTDSAQYAPCLVELTLLLRPSRIDGENNTDGIQRLLNYVQTTLYNVKSQTKLFLKQDNYATVNDTCVVEYEDEPILIMTL